MGRAARDLAASGRRGRRPRATPGTATPDPVSSHLLRLFADVGAVIAVVTAVLYYFGWVHTKHRAYALGYDASAMSLTTTDYILKSLNVLFFPSTLLLIAALVLNVAHRRFVLPAVTAGRPRVVLRAARILGNAWAPLLVVAAILLASPLWGYALPVALALAVLCALYGRALHRAVRGTDPWPPATRALVLVLLGLAVFWTTERIARTTGEAFGADFAANPGQLPAVVVYSAKDLHLDGAGIDETRLRDADSAYLFRYAGLHLLERSGDRYFLITAAPGRVVILREGPDVRVEFRTTPDPR